MVKEYIILCFVAALAGAVNSVAGGGTLLTFPALFATLAAGGVPGAAVVANATSTTALFPGSMAAIWGYRRELRNLELWAFLLVVPSLIGGWLGSRLLTQLPASSFEMLVPWLILVAAVLFTAQPTIARWTGIGKRHAPATAATITGVMLFQLLVSIYGGYFGAGIGILMLSALAMMGFSDIHSMNGLKSLLGSCINGVAMMVFIVAGKVDWPLAIAMAGAASIGGFGGAHVARRMNRDLVRGIVVAIGFSLAAYYFYKQFTADPADLHQSRQSATPSHER
jgi:uncharacterized membrane protein YfcA